MGVTHGHYISNLPSACMCREVNEELLEFECHLKLDYDILRGTKIPYKYYVYGTNHSVEFEYLHGALPQRQRDYNIRNRCLRVKNGKN